ncbi:hypothetical protein GCM10007859_20400 [Brevundimonas denitrificans]|uniref:Uncharacterized protein n=1 Tax=Brevundimonas denitrificans TaxID=1443434 RepID=A0ABQ6BJ22_9CAUL|nr:hypothetical protein GCM10007859_20400 [Brevundimonas denitrificans]
MGVRLTFERPDARHAVARCLRASAESKLAGHKPYVYVNVKYFIFSRVGVSTIGRRKAANCENDSQLAWPRERAPCPRLNSAGHVRVS